MLLIPEIETVVILVPRTGTTALKDAVLATYPKAIRLYRHMEADGVPHGYDRWRKVGVVRDPVERLWSLYKYLQRFGIDYCQKHEPDYTASMRQSVEMPFSDWLIGNQTPFSTPYDSAGKGRFYPAYACLHPMPENRKSQFVYLRPDLGTVIWRYSDVVDLFDYLGLSAVSKVNGSDEAPCPVLSADAQAHVDRWFAWDAAQ